MGPVGRPAVAAGLAYVGALAYVAEPSVEETKVLKQRPRGVRGADTSSYSWNEGCACSSFRNSSRRSRSALIRSVIWYSCSNKLKRKLLVARRAACKDRLPSAASVRNRSTLRASGSRFARFLAGTGREIGR